MKIQLNTILLSSLLVSTAYAVTGTPSANELQPGDFGGGTVVEGFEGIGDLNPHGLLPFDFGSGVQLTDGTRGDSFGARIVDFVDGGGFFGFGTAAHIPEGTAFFAHANAGLFVTAEFSFSEPAIRVGGYVAHSSMTNPAAIIMEAFDADGHLVDSRSVDPVFSDQWSNNFLGVQSILGISTVTLAVEGGSNSVLLDSLHFQSIPEPSAIALALPLVSYLFSSRQINRELGRSQTFILLPGFSDKTLR